MLKEAPSVPLAKASLLRGLWLKGHRRKQKQAPLAQTLTEELLLKTYEACDTEYLRQRKTTLSLDYAFGGRFLRPSAFGTSVVFVVRVHLRQKVMPLPLECSFGGSMRLWRKKKRQQKQWKPVPSPRAPSAVRGRRTASVEIGRIKIECTSVGVRATAEREFALAN